LQVAVPKYPWTDLGYSLAPNGHQGPVDASIYSSSTGSPTSDTGDGNPIGVIKSSYATGFFGEGLANGFFETLPEDIPAWFGRAVGVGDPYDAGSPGTDTDPVMRELRRGLTELRGSYYQDEFWAQERANREVAIFSISGWTDDLFPAVEAFRQFKYLKSLDRLWPVELAVADVGHPRAQNPVSEWHHLNDQAWGFLKEQIHGSHRRQTTVSSLPTICPGPANPQSETGSIQELTGRTHGRSRARHADRQLRVAGKPDESQAAGVSVARLRGSGQPPDRSRFRVSVAESAELPLIHRPDGAADRPLHRLLGLPRSAPHRCRPRRCPR